MTLQLNYSQTQINSLLRHIEWLKEIGLIESYNVNLPNQNTEDFEVTEAEYKKLHQAVREVKNGKFLPMKRLNLRWQHGKTTLENRLVGSGLF